MFAAGDAPADVGDPPGERVRVVLALDFGGTKLAAGLVDLRLGAVIARRRAPSPSSAAESRLTMVAMARQLLAERGRVRPDGVGVSFGGPVDALSGVVRRSYHVAGWESYPLARDLTAQFGVPVVVENDANAAALAEWRWGAGRGSICLVYYTISTGIGGGIVIDGAIHRGAAGFGGEVGHIVIAPNGPPCPCGLRGCVEALCAGPAIARRARERLAERPELATPLRDAMAHAPLTAEVVAAAAAAGDIVASQLYADVAEDLARGMGAVAGVINPNTIVVGGGVSRAGAVLFAPLEAALRRYVFPPARVGLTVVPAHLGDDVALFGAASLAMPHDGAGAPGR